MIDELKNKIGEAKSGQKMEWFKLIQIEWLKDEWLSKWFD